MKASNKNKAIKHSIHYFIGNTAGMLIGFASLFILTRMLPVASYGQLILIVTTLTLLTAFAGFGFPQSSIRYYFKFKKKDQLRRFYSTLVTGSAFIAVIIVLLAQVTNNKVVSAVFSEELSSLLDIALLILFFSVMNELFLGFYRAEHNTVLYNVIFNIRKFLQLGIAIIAIIIFTQEINKYFYAYLFVEIGLFFFFIWKFRNFLKNVFSDFSKQAVMRDC